jgi:hypothetical protein
LVISFPDDEDVEISGQLYLGENLGEAEAEAKKLRLPRLKSFCRGCSQYQRRGEREPKKREKERERRRKRVRERERGKEKDRERERES